MTFAGLVLDAGAFVALDRGNRRLKALIDEARHAGAPLATSAGVVAQVWRGGVHKQVPIAFLLRRTDVVDLTAAQARVVGTILGISGTSDPVDAHIAMIARTRGWPVVTSDAGDLSAIDRTLELYDI